MEHRSNKRFYLGVVLIAIGGILMFERLNLIPWNVADILISWQMLLIAIGGIALLNGNRTGAIVLIVIGTFFLVPDLVDVPYELRRLYWPLILVAVGAAFLFRNKHRSPEACKRRQTGSENNFDDFVIFGGREIFVNSQNLTGGKATSIFGGIEYDLRQAKLSPEGAVIDTFCAFGGCGIKVPLDWNVRSEVNTIVGGFSDKRGDTFQASNYDPNKTLIIKGMTLFGGVEIKHV